jgi:aminoglycoside phosphotransferase (APT) family kinase protein
MYAAASGRDVSDFLFHRVLAMLKLGVIFLQLFARYRRGETRDPRYAELGKFGDSMFEFTVDIIHGRTF